jgi:hypothetical protein
MAHVARASTAGAPALLSTHHFLIGCAPIKNARDSPENNVLDISNRLKKCEFQRAFFTRFALQESPFASDVSRFAIHQSLLTNHALFIASRQNIKNRANPHTTNEKTFSNRHFFAHFGAAPHQSRLTNRNISTRYK